MLATFSEGAEAVAASVDHGARPDRWVTKTLQGAALSFCRTPRQTALAARARPPVVLRAEYGEVSAVARRVSPVCLTA